MLWPIFPRYKLCLVCHGSISFNLVDICNVFVNFCQDEFRAKFLGYNHIDNSFIRSQNQANLTVTAPPASIDWVAKGAVTAVKNQVFLYSVIRHFINECDSPF